MANMEETLALYAAVAASAQTISEEMQAELTRLAVKSKSPAGDKVLARLCVREDASDTVRKAAEKSTRAAVKAAWLSRRDHPAGYVESAIASETRVTVLKAVAEHEDTTEKALDALAGVDNKGVAMAILQRTSPLSDGIRAKAFTALVRNCASLSYREFYVLARISSAHPEAWENAARQVTDKAAIETILNARELYFPVSELPRVTKTVLADWEKTFNPHAENTWNSPGNQKLYQTCQRLIGMAGWQADSEEDQLVATVLHSVLQTPAYQRSPYTPTEVLDCVNRFYGSAKDRAAAAARRAKHEADVLAALTSDDDDRLTQLTSNYDNSIQAALAQNPNLRLKHLETARSGVLVEACLRNGDSVAVAAGMQLAAHMTYTARDFTAGLSDEDKAVAVKVAFERLRSSSHSSYYFAPAFARMLQDSRLTEYVLAAVSVAEVVQVLESGYLSDEAKALVTSTVAETLAAHIAGPEAWEMFSSLAGSIEGPIGEAARIASTV